MIEFGIILGAIVGFITGFILYEKFGWKPYEPDDTDHDFIFVTKSVCGILGAFLMVFVALVFIVLLS